MKQFKLLSMLLAILMVPMMVSCGGDDEKDDNPSGDDLIIKASGTWMCTQSVDALQLILRKYVNSFGII